MRLLRVCFAVVRSKGLIYSGKFQLGIGIFILVPRQFVFNTDTLEQGERGEGCIAHKEG